MKPPDPFPSPSPGDAGGGTTPPPPISLFSPQLPLPNPDPQSPRPDLLPGRLACTILDGGGRDGHGDAAPPRVAGATAHSSSPSSLPGVAPVAFAGPAAAASGPVTSGPASPSPSSPSSMPGAVVAAAGGTSTAVVREVDDAAAPATGHAPVPGSRVPASLYVDACHIRPASAQAPAPSTRPPAATPAPAATTSSTVPAPATSVVRLRIALLVSTLMVGNEWRGGAHFLGTFGSGLLSRKRRRSDASPRCLMDDA
ncbi:vegetative cell wall protein gp1-like [Panicum virgatum]|uniref:vegetative cell wall protein gp1-like n=1 Tax=Panicum virgatum TaxID=38727 RepID=UPI0019D665A2|nr:vegetative cell wall protein gp1-like [Panicum virgatum]